LNISELVLHRTSHLSKKWILYVGDHEVPAELKAIDGVDVVTREGAYSSSSFLLDHNMAAYFTNKSFLSTPRDLAAVIDYFLCSRLPHFIGNSVSTFSAAQIARRGSIASWYNSHSIPLADFFKVFFIPIVYTYTEESSAVGKHLLKVSIWSVRKHMPAASIQMLYHGSNDTKFRDWLAQLNVILHDHQPKWRDKIEIMRLNGMANHSHLYAHAGNYLGTWQRIDIPLYISAEYCLLLDADTVVVRPFSFSDFGLNITATLAFSSEAEGKINSVNAGVALLNIPFLRKTLEEFYSFIWSHPDPKFYLGPSDQGAYRDFYQRRLHKLTYLEVEFNVKPYYRSEDTWRTRKIIHFHGLKPHDILEYWFGGNCSEAIFPMCKAYRDMPFLCKSLQHFGWTALDMGPSVVDDYCYAHFSGWRTNASMCVDFFTGIASRTEPVTETCREYVEKAMVNQGRNPALVPHLNDWQ